MTLEVKGGADVKGILKACEERLKEGRRAREVFEAEWFMNLAFYQGEQWWSWAKTKFHRPVLEKWRVLFVDNRVQPAIRSEVAKLTKSVPTWEAAPASGDDSALEDALLVQRLLQAKWVDLRLQSLLTRVTEWSRVCGAGFWKITWDPEAKDGSEIAIDPQSGEPMENPHKGGLLRKEDVPPELHDKIGFERIGDGEVMVNVRSPFDIYVDPLAGDEGLSSAAWLIEEAVRYPQDVMDRYGLTVRPEADTDASSGLIESRRPGGRSDGGKLGVRVYELWERPCRRHPRGRHVVWCKDVLLAYEENETKGGELPYVMFTGIPVPSRFWPTSMATQLRPLNQEMNKTRSQMRENAARMGNPALLVPQDLKFEWHGAPGEQVPYDAYSGAAPPSFLVPPGIPRSVTDEVAMIENSLDKVSHQSEVSRGQVPAGVTAASAIQLLQEADQTTIAMDAQGYESSISRAGQMVLDLACRFYKTDRLIRIGGEDDTWDISMFRSDMLKRDVPTVQVKQGSMIPRSVAARQALMEHMLALLLQNGVQLDPATLGGFFRQFEVGGLENLVSGFADDARQIAAENAMLGNASKADDQMPPVMDWDNHPAHLQGHARWMKSKRFRLAPDDVKQRFRVHWEAHKDAITKQAMVDAQKQAAMAQEAQGQGEDTPVGQAPGGQANLDLSGGAPDAISPQPGGADASAAAPE